MRKFKRYWQIEKNWHLIVPFLGILGVVYSSIKLSKLLLGSYTRITYVILLTILISFLLIKISLKLFKLLSKKWQVQYRWQMISIFLVFALTGSSSVFIGRPLAHWAGITLETFHPVLYWVIYILFTFTIYQILLITFGWLFGQFNFFLNFEKRMLSKFGFRFLK